MALIQCPECGRERVSDSAEFCPECGYGIKAHFEKIRQEEIVKTEKKSTQHNNRTIIIISVIIIILILGIILLMQKKKNDTALRYLNQIIYLIDDINDIKKNAIDEIDGEKYSFEVNRNYVVDEIMTRVSLIDSDMKHVDEMYPKTRSAINNRIYSLRKSNINTWDDFKEYLENNYYCGRDDMTDKEKCQQIVYDYIESNDIYIKD